VLAQNSDYQVGVAVMDLNSGSLRQYGVEVPFEAASTAKVLTAVAYYEMVEAGDASLDDPMGSYTAGFQLQEMIQDSDNDSWALLVNADDTSAMGVSYDVDGNTLTPADMAHVLAELYDGKLLDQEHTQQLLSYMQNTNDEDLIPAALPVGVTVFHKYGLLGGELHDAAILTTATRGVVLVIYTKGNDPTDIPQQTELIHTITAAVTRTIT
jgi:beta-lactamase class A